MTASLPALHAAASNERKRHTWHTRILKLFDFYAMTSSRRSGLDRFHKHFFPSDQKIEYEVADVAQAPPLYNRVEHVELVLIADGGEGLAQFGKARVVHEVDVPQYQVQARRAASEVAPQLPRRSREGAPSGCESNSAPRSGCSARDRSAW